MFQRCNVLTVLDARGGVEKCLGVRMLGRLQHTSGRPFLDEASVQHHDDSLTDISHDREIVNRNDDSVVFFEDERLMMSRRSRGYAPYPIDLDRETARVLACGTELKNTFTVLDDGRAFVSQHIGDLANQATLDLYAEMVGKFSSWFRFEPEVVAYDLHPDYLSTRWAKGELRVAAGVDDLLPGDVQRVAVQHHHAHIAACMAENQVADPVIGLAFDGTGFGVDGCIWGGEILRAGLDDFDRVDVVDDLALGALSATEIPAVGNDLAVPVARGAGVERRRCPGGARAGEEPPAGQHLPRSAQG